ncbi:hypothetical protein GGI16_005034 [Coemansia sp. S142-1]|nr:hypothetical protein LPJ71_001535 [Coemansia sp. S17]KAJ2095927.1 hypothetical protein GGI16_005034 [Coemansia sp. S142-1]
MSRTPLPQSLDKECVKAAKILNAFVSPGGLGTDKYIPPSILARAKGVAFLSVLKAGFIWSGRVGSGLVVARLPDGRWSAPSAIATAGAGVGGQIGAEITDFVMVLTTDSAVKAFTHGGNVTLGTNVTVAAGPFGRSAEASGAILNLAPVLSYSKSKGLFAGVSLEGSLIAERKDANAKLYGRPVRAQELLSGVINPPPQADVLYRALDLRATPLSNPSTYGTPGSGSGTPGYGTNTMASTPGVSSPAPLAASSSYLNSSISQTGHTTGAAAAGYGAAPGYGASASTSGYGANAASTSGYGANAGTSSGYGANAGTSGYGANAGTSGYGANAGTSSGYGAYAGAAGNGKDRNLETPAALSSAPSAYGADTSTFGAAPPYGAAAAGYKANDESGSSYYTPPAGDTKKRPPPPPPPAPAPANPRAVALYDFAGDQEGDLPFNKGDLITVTEKTESSNDWWKGTCKGRTGNFPSNYVRLD